VFSKSVVLGQMQERARPVHLLVLAVACMTFVVCSACTSVHDLQSSWEELFQPVLLEGYRDFRGHHDGTEYGVIVFSYRLDPGSSTSATIPAIKKRFEERHGCYRVLSETAVAIHLRCTPRSERFHEIEEFRFTFDPRSRRVFALSMADVPPSEARYRELTTALEEAQRRSP
jgi:hypothetical protein